MLPTDDSDPDEHTYERQTYQPTNAGASALGQYRHDVPEWPVLLEKSKNSRDMLLDLLAKAQNMGADQTVIDSIKAAGTALASRS